MTAIRPDGFKGVAFRRGHVLSEADIPMLLDMGKSHIFVWTPNQDEVHEEDAGRVGALALAGEGVAFSYAGEGRWTLEAQQDGLLVIDSATLRMLNEIPDYTAATLPNYVTVSTNERIAGVRIIPLVTAQENVSTVEALTKTHGAILHVYPFRPLRVGCIITGSEVFEGRVKDRFEPVLREKIAEYDGEILGVTKCPDDVTAILQAAQDFLDSGAQLLLFTGGMSVDPDDLTPTAIRQSGAELVAQGVPVQPGNMLMLAYLENTALIGVPGAAMHHGVTSLDLILPRIFAGICITRDDLLSLGEGGLLL